MPDALKTYLDTVPGKQTLDPEKLLAYTAAMETPEPKPARVKPPPSHAPYFAAMYPELARIAKEHGYALSVHGSLQRDMDLVAIPWADDVSRPEVLMDAFCAFYAIKRISEVEPKNHGRVAYTLTLSWGECFIDLSFLPATAYRPSDQTDPSPEIKAS